MKPFKTFQPDLIVEVTGVCDRACAGCYAPNLISKFSPEELYKEKPELFLTANRLSESLIDLKKNIGSIALRGGEPSRHPHLSDLLKVAHENAKDVYIETHARWVLNQPESNTLLETCKDLSTVIKISFDRMHGLSQSELKSITDKLSSAQVQYVIAITEVNESVFNATRALCAWIPNEQIIFQKKTTKSHELVSPTIGIINLIGSLSRNLNVRNEFTPMPAFVGF